MTSVAPPLSPTANTESIPGIETAEGLHSPRRMVAVKVASRASFPPPFHNQQFRVLLLLKLMSAVHDQ